MNPRLSNAVNFGRGGFHGWRGASARRGESLTRLTPLVYGVIWLVAATALVGVFDVWFEVALFVVYVAVIVCITASFGPAWGVATAVIAWLLSTYLFVPPRFALALDASLVVLAPYYFGCVLLCHLVRVRQRRAEAERLFLRLPGRYTPSDN